MKMSGSIRQTEYKGHRFVASRQFPPRLAWPWNSQPGSGGSPVWTRPFFDGRATHPVLYSPKTCSIPACVSLIHHSSGAEGPLGCSEE